MRLESFLSQNATRRSYKTGETVFLKGNQADAAYYIVSGRIEIFQDVDMEASVMAVLGPDEIFGEMALLRFDEYTLSARALEPTEVLVIAPEILQGELRQTPPLVRAILNMLVDRIHSVNEVLSDLDRANKI